MNTLVAKKREKRESTQYIRNVEKYIPAVLYGEGVEENILLKVPDNVFRSIYREIKNGERFQLEVDSKNYQVVLKEMQVHPTTGAVLHLDFFALNV